MYRYKEKDSRTPNWIELPVHPPEARRVQIHNLSQGTIYEFQVNIMLNIFFFVPHFECRVH